MSKALEILSADLGMPGPCNFYDAITQLINNNNVVINSESYIPYTVIVGAQINPNPIPAIGSTPHAPTIESALALVPSTSVNNWTLLIMPGTYTGDQVTISTGVCLTALEPNTVTISQPVSFDDSSSNNYSAYATNITFTQEIDVISTGKTAGTYTTLFEECIFTGAVSIQIRAGDIAQFDECNISSTFLYVGGTVQLNQCISSSNLTVNTSVFSSSYLEINGGVIGPITIESEGLVASTGAVIWGTWLVSGASSKLLISSCRPVYDNTTQYIAWLLDVTLGGIANLLNTRVNHVVDIIDTNGNWTVTSPSITSDATGTIDRDIYISAMPPLAPIASTINITLATPLITSPIPTLPPVTGNQPIVTVVQISGAPGASYLSSTSTNSTITIINQITVAGVPLNVSIIPPTP